MVACHAQWCFISETGMTLNFERGGLILHVWEQNYILQGKRNKYCRQLSRRMCSVVNCTLFVQFHFKLIFAFRTVEGTVPTYHHDRYPDCSPMVHLWCSQGHPWPTPSSSTLHARVPKVEAWSEATVNSFSIPHSDLNQQFAPFMKCKF